MNKERILVNVLKYTLGIPVLLIISVTMIVGSCIVLFFETVGSFLGKVTNTPPNEDDTHKDRMDDFKLFLNFDVWKPWKKQAPEESCVRLESIFGVLSEIRDNTSKDND